VPHLHTHVVPRYQDDPAAGGPIPWELVRSELPTDEAVLARQAEAIRAALER
jgi:diadenosine tetraphosphate (Ap4A) HIT family hydrolase